MRLSALGRFGILAFAVIQLAACSGAQEAARGPVGKDLSGTINEAVPNAGSFARWQKVIARFDQQRDDPIAICAPATPTCPRDEWDKLVAELKRLPLHERVARANEILNRLPYVPAERNWGDATYWETPYEFLAHGGQCQDYAIAKYLALAESGVPQRDMRFVVVRDTLRGLDHAIDIVTIEGVQLVLDNQVRDVTPAQGNLRYQPYYALNDQGWWIYGIAQSHMTLAQATQVTGSAFRLARY